MEALSVLLWSKDEMDLEVVVQKAAKKAGALSEVRFVEISGSVLGLASSLNPRLSSKKHLRSFDLAKLL